MVSSVRKSTGITREIERERVTIRRDDVALEVTLFILKKAADEQLHGSSPAGGEPRS